MLFCRHTVFAGLQEGKAQMYDKVQELVEWLEATMQQHPLLPLRNMAFWTLDCLLDALQVHLCTALMSPLLIQEGTGDACAIMCTVRLPGLWTASKMPCK